MVLNDYQRNLQDEWVAWISYNKMGEKTTVVLLKLHNGFEVVGTSACVDPKDFDKAIGEHLAVVDALNKLDGYVGFYRQMNQK